MRCRRGGDSSASLRAVAKAAPTWLAGHRLEAESGRLPTEGSSAGSNWYQGTASAPLSHRQRPWRCRVLPSAEASPQDKSAYGPRAPANTSLHQPGILAPGIRAAYPQGVPRHSFARLNSGRMLVNRPLAQRRIIDRKRPILSSDRLLDRWPGPSGIQIDETQLSGLDRSSWRSSAERAAACSGGFCQARAQRVAARSTTAVFSSSSADQERSCRPPGKEVTAIGQLSLPPDNNNTQRAISPSAMPGSAPPPPRAVRGLGCLRPRSPIRLPLKRIAGQQRHHPHLNRHGRGRAAAVS